MKQSFTDEEMERVCAVLTERNAYSNDAQLYNRTVVACMIRVSRYTGLRPRELKGLVRADVDFENSLIHIRPNNSNNIKTQSSIRSVPMNSIVKAEMVALCALSPYEYPFSFHGGIIPTPGQLATLIENAAKAAGVPGFHLYGMRHSFDSELITNGVDPRTVMDLMGHANVSTTLAVYARSTEEKRREAIEKVENGRKVS